MKYVDSTNNTIKVGDRVRFREHTYTIYRFLAPVSPFDDIDIEFEEPLFSDTSEQPTDTNVDRLDVWESRRG